MNTNSQLQGKNETSHQSKRDTKVKYTSLIHPIQGPKRPHAIFYAQRKTNIPNQEN